MSLLKLPVELTNRSFTTEEARQNGLTKYDLKCLIEAGELIKISRGYYQSSTSDLISDEALFQKAILRVGEPSSICLVSALAHYGLTDLIGKKVWVMVEADRRRYYSDIRLLRVRDPVWSIGIEKEVGYWITSLDRTLVESLIYKRFIGINTGIESIRTAVRNKKTNLDRIFEMGKKLEVDHRILPYLEALSV